MSPPGRPSEIHEIDAETFARDLTPLYQPTVLRGVARDWPAVQAARTSPRSLADYLKRFDKGATVEAMLGAPAIGGRFFYDESGRGMNFDRRPAPLGQALDELLRLADHPEPPAIYVGSTPIAPILPGFERANRMDLLDEKIPARLWLGNASIIQTHHDMSDNIAVVVSGQRRFTLFPPDQVGNLYIGPLDFTPAGRPVSMVALDDPDLQRFPKFAEALENALVADLEPGDAIYIPSLWWHHVQATGPLNMLVNYWWEPADMMANGMAGQPFDAFVHALRNVRRLPAQRRNAWRAFFEHYVFHANGDPAEHIPEGRRGVLEDKPDARREAEMTAFLRRVLGRD
jgi:hypothetical protein